VLHEGNIEKRSQFVIEGLFAVRKAGFEASGFKAVAPELDLVDAGVCVWVCVCVWVGGWVCLCICVCVCVWCKFTW